MVNMLPEMIIEERILLVLAQNNKPQTHYQLWKTHHVARSNKTVLTTLERLRNNGMIKSEQEEKGRKRKFYTLTFEGLIACLRHESAWRSIDQLAKAQRAMLPLIFGKWDFFRAEEILDEIIQRFKGVALFLWESMTTIVVIPTDIRDFQRLWNGNLNQIIAKENKTVRGKRRVQVAGLVFGVGRLPLLPMNMPSQMSKDPQKMFKKIEPFVEEQKRLLQVLQRDAELKKYIRWLLQSMERDITYQSENVESWRKWFQEVSEK